MNMDERNTKVNPASNPDDNGNHGTKVNVHTQESSSGFATKVNSASNQTSTSENGYNGTRVNPNTNHEDPVSRAHGLKEGEIFADKYRIVSRLDNSGGEAVLYICTLVEASNGFLIVGQDKYCLKIYKDSAYIRQDVRGILQGIKHQNIAPIIDWGVCNDMFYEVFELYKGETLTSVIKKKLIREDDLALYLRQMAEALKVLHENGIVHQDVKPSNYMVIDSSFFGEGRKLKLFDFGICAPFGKTDGRTHVTVIGKTHYYSAPEVLLTSLCWPASDFYSLGITLIEILTGKTPFEDYDDSNNMRKISDMQKINIPILLQFSPRTQALIVGLLQFERQDRWGYEEITKWLTGHYSETLWRKWKEQIEGKSKLVFSFLGKEYSIPSEIPSLVTQMAFNWNDGITEISEHRDTKGQFTRLLYELDKTLKQDTSGFSSEDLEQLWKLEKVCNNTNSEKIDSHFFYLQKLYALYPEFRFFAWRGYVAKDPQSLGIGILSALWDEEIRKESPSSVFDDSPRDVSSNSNYSSPLRYAVLKTLFEKHIVSWYLKTINDTSYESVARYENAIVSCSIKNEVPDYYYYKIGYLLSKSSEVRIVGINEIHDKESFIAYINTLIANCSSSGNLSQFQSFIHQIYFNRSKPSSIRLADRMAAQNEPNLGAGFVAWVESQGLKDALDDLIRGLKEKKTI